MVSVVKRSVDYLADPLLVRRIQERLGVKLVADGKLADTPPSPVDAKHHLQPRRGGGDAGAAGSAANGLVNGYRWLSSKTRKRVKTSESASPESSPEPTSDIVVETYSLLNILFRLATELGHEPFYITYFPFLMWNTDTAMGRHTVVIWCFSMYVGQACKALFKWKRPSCPPAIRLVTNPALETEYGLPSTHATVATTVPFYHLYFLYHRYNVS